MFSPKFIKGKLFFHFIFIKQKRIVCEFISLEDEKQKHHYSLGIFKV